MNALLRRLLPIFLFVCLVAASLPAAAAVIKSVRTGSLVPIPGGMAGPALFQNVNLVPAVDATRSFVVCYINNTNSGAVERVTCELNAAGTIITFTSSVVNAATNVQWYVAEFLSGVSVQRNVSGTPVIMAVGAGGATVNVALAAVNTDRSFALVTTRNATNDNISDEQWTVRARLTTTTNLELFRNDTASATSVAWQVVQIDDAFVQSGIVSIGTALGGPVATTATVNLVALAPPVPVDTSRTFLIFSYAAGTATGGDETLYATTGEITNSTTLTFTRGRGVAATANIQVDIAWSAIWMTDGTKVQSGLSPGAGAPPLTAALAPPGVTVSQSLPIVSTRDSSVSATADMDEIDWIPTFPVGVTAATLNLGKTASNNFTTPISWFVVQFNNTPIIVDRLEVFP